MYITHYYQFLYDLSNYIGAIFFLFLPPPSSHILKNKVHYSWKISHPHAIQDEFVSSWELIWRNVALHHLLTNGSSAVNGCRQTLIAGLEWCGLLVDYCDFYQLFGLNLTAPIHCRGSIGEQVMQCSKSVPMKKQTHLHLDIFSKFSFLGELFL